MDVAFGRKARLRRPPRGRPQFARSQWMTAMARNKGLLLFGDIQLGYREGDCRDYRKLLRKRPLMAQVARKKGGLLSGAGIERATDHVLPWPVPSRKIPTWPNGPMETPGRRRSAVRFLAGVYDRRDGPMRSRPRSWPSGLWSTSSARRLGAASRTRHRPAPPVRWVELRIDSGSD